MAEKKTRRRRVKGKGPNSATIRPKPRPCTASTMGYRAEIGSRQLAHRPRRNSHENTGMFCQGLIAAPQRGQREGGDTIDCSRGRRWMTTLAKLPTTSPKSRAIPAATRAGESTRPDMFSPGA
jgi:hypothetical protein